MKKILFYVEQEYYWASLEPVYKEFLKDKNYKVSIKIGGNQKKYFKLFLISQKKKIEKRFIQDGYQITDKYRGFDAVFCGSQVKNPGRFGDVLFFNIDHGPGIKTLRYRHLLKQKNTKYCLFVEGKYRLEKFKKYGIDKIHDIYVTGLPKLDVFFDGTYHKFDLLKTYGLDIEKKTVLYAPSYKPTSIFAITDKLLYLADKYNVIIKLHPYSWNGKYASHSHHRYVKSIVNKDTRIKLIGPQVQDIRPFLFVADTIISDGSSVINEFLALEKCGIIVNLEEENLLNRNGTPILENSSVEWLKDAFIHISPDDNILTAVENALSPSEERLENIKKEKDYIFSYSDSKSAHRVKEISSKLINFNSSKVKYKGSNDD